MGYCFHLNVQKNKCVANLHLNYVLIWGWTFPQETDSSDVDSNDKLLIRIGPKVDNSSSTTTSSTTSTTTASTSSSTTSATSCEGGDFSVLIELKCFEHYYHHVIIRHYNIMSAFPRSMIGNEVIMCFVVILFSSPLLC